MLQAGMRSSLVVAVLVAPAFCADGPFAADLTGLLFFATDFFAVAFLRLAFF